MQIPSAAAKIFNERGYRDLRGGRRGGLWASAKPVLYYWPEEQGRHPVRMLPIATEQLHTMLDEVRRADVNGWDRLVAVPGAMRA